MYGTREAHKRLFKALALVGPNVYASSPMKVDFVRHGTIHILTSNNGSDGGTVKLYGSNVYPLNKDGEAMDENAIERMVVTLGIPANGGVITPATALVKWVDMTTISPIYGFNLPTAPGNVSTAIPIPSWDLNWLLMVVAPAGSNPITIDAFAKFKSGA